MALEGAGYRDWEEGVEDKPRTQIARRRLPQVELTWQPGDSGEMLRYPAAGGLQGAFRSGDEGDESSGKEGGEWVSGDCKGGVGVQGSGSVFWKSLHLYTQDVLALL